MINELTSKPIFGFTLCIIAYYMGVLAKRRFNYPFVNPVVVGSILIIGVLTLFRIPLDNFLSGGSIITMLLAPTTAVLALSMFRHVKIIKKNLVPILVGCTVGVVSAVCSILVLCKVFGISDELTASILPKSITTAIAVELSAKLGGIPPITVAAVTVTGVFGTILSPYFIKWSRLNNSIASGLAIGASCHALGTTKAIEIGEVEGSLSGIAVGLCGLLTVILAIFL